MACLIRQLRAWGIITTTRRMGRTMEIGIIRRCQVINPILTTHQTTGGTLCPVLGTTQDIRRRPYPGCILVTTATRRITIPKHGIQDTICWELEPSLVDAHCDRKQAELGNEGSNLDPIQCIRDIIEVAVQLRKVGMFGLCVKIVMLLSFTAHAVLGCCLHHQHDSCCQPSPTPSVVNVDSAGSKVTCEGKCCHHKTSIADTKTAPVEPPSHPSDGCSQPDCAFLLTKSSTSVDLDCITLSYSAAVAEYFIPQAMCSSSLRRVQPVNYPLDGSAAAHCILQGSWQL